MNETTSHNIRICHAQPTNIPVLVEMWQGIDQFPNAERPFGGDSADKPEHAKRLLEQTLKSPNAVVLTAQDANGNIIGTISGHVFDKPAVVLTQVGVIYSLWVNQSQRRQGIAQQLLSQLEVELQQKGAKTFQVGWDIPNTLASAWWQKRGYNAYEIIASKTISVEENT